MALAIQSGPWTDAQQQEQARPGAVGGWRQASLSPCSQRKASFGREHCSLVKQDGPLLHAASIEVPIDGPGSSPLTFDECMIADALSEPGYLRMSEICVRRYPRIDDEGAAMRTSYSFSATGWMEAAGTNFQGVRSVSIASCPA